MDALPTNAPSAGARRASACVLAALAVVGALCLLANWRQPLVRNGLVYARASERVIEHGFDPRPVVLDSQLSYDKPIGFAWLASPLVASLGTHRGLMLVSFAGTLAYLLATWFVASAWGLSDRERALLMLFAGLNPIVAYQFWSAHPDSLFAALYLSAFGLARGIVRRPTFLGVGLFFAALLAALILKNYALILLPSMALYFAWHRRRILSASGGRRVALAILGAFAVLATLVVLGRAGHNPLMRIEGEGGGAGQYGEGDWARSAMGTWLQVGLTLLVNLQLALPLTLRARAGIERSAPNAAGAGDSGPGLVSELVCFPLAYIAGLMLFPTTFYNMRYFVPLLPFAALLAVLGWRASAGFVRRFAPPAFAAVGLLLVLVFDDGRVYARASVAIPRLEVTWLHVPLSFFDNLRMPMHLAQAAVLDNLNEKVERNGLVYMLDVAYYGDAQQGVYERAGLIRRDIQTRYVSSRAFEPSEERYYLFASMVRDPSRLSPLGAVTDLGLGLFRIEAAPH